MIAEEQIKELFEVASDYRKRAYSPYSHFQVGAALLTKEGKIYGGCNIENAAFGPTNCAERTAFFKAVSEGEREFSAIVIVGGKEGEKEGFCSPCGVCRQVMAEFCNPESFYIIMGNSAADCKIFLLKEVLPLNFGAQNIQ